MTDLSTYAGQAAHYAGVKARLGMAFEPRRVRLPAPVVETPPVVEFEPVEVVQPVEEVPPAPKARAAWRRILGEVADKHEVPIATILSASRFRKVVYARQEAFYRIRTETTLSLPQIGQRFRKDHSTVHYGILSYVEREGQELTDAKVKRMPVWGVGGWH